MIYQDFGKHLEELFSEFEKEPIAAASIAQGKSFILRSYKEQEQRQQHSMNLLNLKNSFPLASSSSSLPHSHLLITTRIFTTVHRARTKDGQLVAVKIQMPYLRRYFHNDMDTNDIANKFCIKLYYMQDDAENIDALVTLNNKFNDELREGLFTELNFLHEANNAKKAAKNMRKRRDVYIPKVYSEFTSSRVLTMEFIENAVKADNVEAIRKMGFSESDISKRILSSFADQIMVQGFIHCDPHPSNIMVRRNPKVSVCIMFYYYFYIYNLFSVMFFTHVLYSF